MLVNSYITELPLKEMDGTLLNYAILDEAKVNSVSLSMVEDAIRLAAYLHRNDIRQARGKNLTDNYINHPLRNTLRLMRLGVYDTDVIVACILHDTVEDHPKDIVKNLSGENYKDFEDSSVASRMQLRSWALSYIADIFNPEVARIVEKVSNLPLERGLSKELKREEYIKHVTEVITDDPHVFLVKVSDFIDNAVGLYHTQSNPAMVQHLSRKYLPLISVFKEQLMKLDFPLSSGSRNRIMRQLEDGEKRLTEMMVADV
jgi:(p)ppGpp synthase/HD superfamily hydrolase